MIWSIPVLDQMIVEGQRKRGEQIDESLPFVLYGLYHCYQNTEYVVRERWFVFISLISIEEKVRVNLNVQLYLNDSDKQ